MALGKAEHANIKTRGMARFNEITLNAKGVFFNMIEEELCGKGRSNQPAGTVASINKEPFMEGAEGIGDIIGIFLNHCIIDHEALKVRDRANNGEIVRAR